MSLGIKYPKAPYLPLHVPWVVPSSPVKVAEDKFGLTGATEDEPAGPKKIPLNTGLAPVTLMITSPCKFQMAYSPEEKLEKYSVSRTAPVRASVIVMVSARVL